MMMLSFAIGIAYPPERAGEHDDDAALYWPLAAVSPRLTCVTQSGCDVVAT
jgi:hypothetical protein